MIVKICGGPWWLGYNFQLIIIAKRYRFPKTIARKAAHSGCKRPLTPGLTGLPAPRQPRLSESKEACNQFRPGHYKRFYLGSIPAKTNAGLNHAMNTDTVTQKCIGIVLAGIAWEITSEIAMT
ncbi:MAG: hypothetical protein NTY37_06630 [Methanothrix sp.]|nr:hypothetical protein [Methanothrix sp.]